MTSWQMSCSSSTPRFLWALAANLVQSSLILDKRFKLDIYQLEAAKRMPTTGIEPVIFAFVKQYKCNALATMLSRLQSCDFNSFSCLTMVQDAPDSDRLR